MHTSNDTNDRVLLLGTVRGLVSEGMRAREVIEAVKPNVVGLSISPEALDGLSSHQKNGGGAVGPDNAEEEIYISELGKYGEVMKPPPCFAEALRLCKTKGITVIGLDMNEEHFTDAYCSHISGLEMVMQGRRLKKLGRRDFVSASAEDFVMELDRAINASKGFQALEKDRESVIAKNIVKLRRNDVRVLAVVELERLRGVRDSLLALGCAFDVL
jgi:pheromone shutdown protein TraB